MFQKTWTSFSRFRLQLRRACQILQHILAVLCVLGEAFLDGRIKNLLVEFPILVDEDIPKPNGIGNPLPECFGVHPEFDQQKEALLEIKW